MFLGAALVYYRPAPVFQSGWAADSPKDLVPERAKSPGGRGGRESNPPSRLSVHPGRQVVLSSDTCRLALHLVEPICEDWRSAFEFALVRVTGGRPAAPPPCGGPRWPGERDVSGPLRRGRTCRTSGPGAV